MNISRSIPRYRIDHFSNFELLAKGTYGTVYKANDTTTGECVALKRCDFDCPQRGIPCTVMREFSFLNNFCHDHILRYSKIFFLIYPKPKVSPLFSLPQRLRGYIDSAHDHIYFVFDYIDSDLRGILNDCRSANKKMDLCYIQVMKTLISSENWAHLYIFLVFGCSNIGCC